MDILSEFISDEQKSILFSTHITTDLEKIADFITFIHNGKIVYSDTKDHLMEKYCVVKGGLGLLSREQEKKIIGYRQHGFGFDGLTERDSIRTLPSSVVTEACSLDEIVVRFNMLGGKSYE